MKLNIYLEIAEEAKRLTLEGLEYRTALNKAKQMYCKQLEEAEKINPWGCENER